MPRRPYWRGNYFYTGLNFCLVAKCNGIISFMLNKHSAAVLSPLAIDFKALYLLLLHFYRQPSNDIQTLFADRYDYFT